ncbi:DcaP family trimeric outer membrane transporter [Roseovarius rhodophyticola]|uniref:DcaP family trimeric outer membrane transporter n=1 Tax=Roseovarius rhodophyticola TaxID=3080827 RepID=A0ABZ2TH44_9RHOB|nr:DcaP family trimeric outer membrane transporter [Roseovarius sp. W115]MDV2928676.1 DcaP family trimeric outer membrane transporter [Roseovarius sp. W115]
MNHFKLKAGVCIASLFATASLATADELQELRDRIDALEAQQAQLEAQQTKPQRQTLPGAIPNLGSFILPRAESLGDPDQISGREGLGRLSFALSEQTKVTIYGFVRAEAFYDFDFSQGDTSDPSALLDPANETSGDFEQSVRVSRFGIRSKSDTGIGTFSTQLEFDLFSEDASTTSPDLRLRHANIRYKTGNSEVLLGQFWTNFMPLTHYPTTADFEGPVGISFARVPQVRYTYDTGTGLRLSASLEEANGGENSEDPVLTAAAFYGQDRFSVRAAGLIGTRPTPVGDVDTYGVTVSGSVSPWQGGTFTGTYTHGDNLGNLLIGPGGDPDALGTDNDVDAFTLEFRQDLGDKWNVGVAYGYANYGLETVVAGNAFDEVQTVHVNAFYTPVENFTLGFEYIFADIEGDAFSEDADRLGFSATLRF